MRTEDYLTAPPVAAPGELQPTSTQEAEWLPYTGSAFGVRLLGR